MLIKRKNLMTSRAGFVKKLACSSLAATALSAAFIAPASAAENSLLVNKTVSVKFKISDLKADGGNDKVYAKLKHRATSFCRADNATLQYFAQSKTECVEDLMDQFIDSANIETLKTIHLSQKSLAPVKKYALK